MPTENKRHIQCVISVKEANELMTFARETGSTQQKLLSAVVKNFISVEIPKKLKERKEKEIENGKTKKTEEDFNRCTKN